MDEIKKRIAEILDKFAQQEIGNRLSEFAMVSLKVFILQEFDKQKEEVRKDV
jgi:hypothetical protein